MKDTHTFKKNLVNDVYLTLHDRKRKEKGVSIQLGLARRSKKRLKSHGKGNRKLFCLIVRKSYLGIAQGGVYLLSDELPQGCPIKWRKEQRNLNNLFEKGL